MNDLERELEDKEDTCQKEITDVQTRSEESLAQLKNFYEQEKDRLETKIKDDKEKAQKRVIQLQEEFDLRLKDDQQNHEDELDMLQGDLRDREMTIQGISNNYEHEMSMKDQKIDQLESYQGELKESLNQIHERNTQTIDQERDSYKAERKSLNDKIDDLVSQVKSKEREATSLLTSKQNLEESLKK